MYRKPKNEIWYKKSEKQLLSILI